MLIFFPRSFMAEKEISCHLGTILANRWMMYQLHQEVKNWTNMAWHGFHAPRHTHNPWSSNTRDWGVTVVQGDIGRKWEVDTLPSSQANIFFFHKLQLFSCKVHDTYFSLRMSCSITPSSVQRERKSMWHRFRNKISRTFISLSKKSLETRLYYFKTQLHTHCFVEVSISTK